MTVIVVAEDVVVAEVEEVVEAEAVAMEIVKMEMMIMMEVKMVRTSLIAKSLVNFIFHPKMIMKMKCLMLAFQVASILASLIRFQ